MDDIKLSATVELTAASEGKPPRVSILAYTGGQMQVSTYGEVIIDLAGLTLPSSIPLLADHMSTLANVAGVGTPTVRGGQLYVDGTLASNATGQAIIALARDKVPLQASVGVKTGDRQAIRAGEKATVNGREITAGAKGATLFRTGSLQEVSILPLGADSSTTVHISARKGNRMPNETTDTATDPTIQAERSRITSIVNACAGNHAELQGRAIDDNWTVEAVKAALYDSGDKRAALQTLRAGFPGLRSSGLAAGGGSTLSAGASPRDMIVASCLLAAGRGELLAKSGRMGEQLANTVHRPSGWPELCAAALRAEGRDVPHDRSELLKAGFSTTSMPTAIGEGIEKIALQVFLDASSNWKMLAKVVNAQSFRQGAAIRLATTGKFTKIARGGEIRYGAIGEEAFKYQIATYGEIYGITREDIIDDNLGLLAEIPTVVGNDSAKALADTFFNTLIANTDATGAFFSTGRGNLGSEILDYDSLTGAITALRTRTDAGGRIIGIQPSTLVVPAALEFTARQLLNSAHLFRDQSVDSQPMGNPLSEVNLQLMIEPRLDAASTTDWYMFGNQVYGAILVALLGGKMGPTIETFQQDADMLGIKIRGFMDWGVSLAEFRSAYKSDVAPYA